MGEPSGPDRRPRPPRGQVVGGILIVVIGVVLLAGLVIDWRSTGRVEATGMGVGVAMIGGGLALYPGLWPRQR